MPLPRWLALVNKRVFNPMELRRGHSPVLIHTGRSSGATYRTPLDAHPVAGGYLFILNYGSTSDWVQNVMVAGDATLEVGGEEIRLTSPRLVLEEVAWQLLPETTKAPAGFMRVTEYLQMESRQ